MIFTTDRNKLICFHSQIGHMRIFFLDEYLISHSDSTKYRELDKNKKKEKTFKKQGV